MVYDPDGVWQAMVTDWLWMAQTSRVNAAGFLRLGFPADHGITAYLSERAQFILQRADPDNNIAWRNEFEGFYLSNRREEKQKTRSLQITLYGWNVMLYWRIVAWAAGTTDRSVFTATPAETIAKTIVKYNCTVDATVANGRLLEGNLVDVGRTFQVATDVAGGNSLDWSCFGENVLATLQKLARVGGGDFAVVRTAAATWEFRFYAGQLGTDRSATVMFSIERGNMGSPTYDYSRVDERAAVVVGGKETGSNRAFRVRTSGAYDAGVNDAEVFLNASDIETQDGLDARGDALLDKLRPVETFRFQVLQTPGSLYGSHYFLGDKVTAVNPFTAVSVTQKIVERTLAMDQQGHETVQIVTETV